MSSIAHELITRGWRKGSLVGDDGSVCLTAAAQFATLDDLSPNGCMDYGVPREAREALHQALPAEAFNPITGEKIIWAWNDRPERTFDEVLRVAKEADEILDAWR